MRKAMIFFIAFMMILGIDFTGYASKNGQNQKYIYTRQLPKRYFYKELQEGQWERNELEKKIKTTLTKLGFNPSKKEIELILGTAAVETDFGSNIKKTGKAVGIFQIEPDTAKYISEKLIEKDKTYEQKIEKVLWENVKYNYQLAKNLELQILISYMIYQYRGADKFKMTDKHSYSYIWKKLWNTKAGKGTKSAFLNKWKLYCEES